MIEKFITLMLAGRDEEKGATAVEYGLMVALIAVVIVGGVTVFGIGVSQLFTIPAGVFSP
jgi:pilus assembly protein Flp/PilA